jgi:hypothetical protein
VTVGPGPSPLPPHARPSCAEVHTPDDELRNDQSAALVRWKPSASTLRRLRQIAKVVRRLAASSMKTLIKGGLLAGYRLQPPTTTWRTTQTGNPDAEAQA